MVNGMRFFLYSLNLHTVELEVSFFLNFDVRSFDQKDLQKEKNYVFGKKKTVFFKDMWTKIFILLDFLRKFPI